MIVMISTLFGECPFVGAFFGVLLRFGFCLYLKKSDYAGL